MRRLFSPSGPIPDSSELSPRQQATRIYLKYLWLRVHRYKFNTAIATTGNPGSGKTLQAILTAYLLNRKRFDETHYVNKPREFLEAVDDSRRGDSIVWDEVGVSLSSRKWQSLSNILTAETLQTYRVNKLTVFFCLPDLSFCDVQARKLMTMFQEVKRSGTNQADVWTYDLSVDRKEGKMYFKAYRMLLGARLVKMPWVSIPYTTLKAVPKELLAAIHEKEQAFKDSIRKQSLRTIEMIEKDEDGGSSRDTIYDNINAVQKDIEKYRSAKGILDTDLIQYGLHVSATKARQIKKFIEKG